MSSKEHLTIMILEDNRADVHLLKEALRKAELNFTAVVFGDGESAFRYINRETEADPGPLPDVAILDLNVPKRDGSEVLVHIRQHPELHRIPVLILSSSPKDVMRNRAAEADCYITKPSDLHSFLGIGDEIRECVETVRATRVSPFPQSTADGQPHAPDSQIGAGAGNHSPYMPDMPEGLKVTKE